MNKPHESDKYKEEIFRLFDTMSGTKLARQLGCEPSIIEYCITKYKLKRTKKSQCRYSANHDFFKIIDTEGKAYFLGLLASDGCVSKNKTVNIQLNVKDIELLEKFKNELKATHPIRISKIDKRTDTIMAGLYVYSPTMVIDLEKYGIIPAKTGKLKWDLIENGVPKHLLRFFCLGYWDGDGGFSGRKRLTYKICGQDGDFMKSLFNCIKTESGCFGGNIYPRTGRIDFWDINFGGKTQIRILYKYLYEGTTIFLSRKRLKADEYLARTKIVKKNKMPLCQEAWDALEKLGLLEDYDTLGTLEYSKENQAKH